MTTRILRATRSFGVAPWACFLAMMAVVGCGETGKNSGKDAGDASVVRGVQDGSQTDGQGTGERVEGVEIPEDAGTVADTRADRIPDSLVVVPDARIEADTALVDVALASDTPVVPPDASVNVDVARDAMGSGTGGSSGTVDARGGADGTVSSTAGSTGGTAGSSSTSSGAGGYVWSCGAGNHNGGDGTCVPKGTCSSGYHLNDGGGCVANTDAGSSDVSVDVARDTAVAGDTATEVPPVVPPDAPIEVPHDATPDTVPDQMPDATVCPPGRVGADCKTCRIHVKTDGLDSNDGTTWAKSIKSVQQALTMAASQVSGDATACEIWVATGTYKPTGDNDRTATFLLRDKVGLYGGFLGNESRLGDRVPGWVTTLSGNIGDEGSDRDNSYHVVTGASGATLDGFTITGGYADGSNSNQGFGGGMYNEDASPTVANCIFTANTADVGGGMAIRSLAPNLINCTFTNNHALFAGGGIVDYYGTPTVVGCSFIGNRADSYGGGMFNMNAAPTIVDSTFAENSADFGGGMVTAYGTPTVTNCHFDGNTSAYFGGGIYNTGASIKVTGCTFTGNSSNSGGGLTLVSDSWPIVENCSFVRNGAADNGGGLYIEKGSPTITNCTFASNHANYGGGMSDRGVQTSITNCTFTANSATSYAGGIDSVALEERVTNTILWNDKAPSDPEIKSSSGSLTVSHSIVQGGFSGDSNLAGDPLFVSETDLHLRGESPAIDKGSDACPAGAPVTDKEGKARLDITNVPNAADMHGVDIGAYEYQGSDTTPGTPVPALCPLPEGHWYLGSAGQSCDEVCASHGGCNTAATIGIGSGAGAKTDSLFWTCAAVLNHLGAPATPMNGDVDTCTDGFGCEVDSTLGSSRCLAPATTTSAASATTQRACACVN